LNDQMTLFGPDGSEPEPATDEVRTLRVMITVKAAPNPSQTYGEAVCVAGVSVDPNHPGWIRLYPVNFRYLEQDTRFSKYDIVTVEAQRAQADGRNECWRPRMATLRVEKSLRAWDRRRPHVAPYMNTTMCELNAASRGEGVGPSLGLVRAASVEDFVVEAHPGWTGDEQTKIDNYVGQLDLFGGEDRTPWRRRASRAPITGTAFARVAEGTSRATSTGSWSRSSAGCARSALPNSPTP